jgi:hypothetical protein
MAWLAHGDDWPLFAGLVIREIYKDYLQKYGPENVHIHLLATLKSRNNEFYHILCEVELNPVQFSALVRAFLAYFHNEPHDPADESNFHITSVVASSRMTELLARRGNSNLLEKKLNDIVRRIN